MGRRLFPQAHRQEPPGDLASRRVPSLPISPDAPQWHVKEEDIAEAIRLANSSSPGPNGVPFSAWKAVGQDAVDILFAAAVALQQGALSESDLRGVNSAIVCCLPKKADGVHETHGSFYSPKGTRPLSVVNTDNRLIASAFRLVCEPVFSDFVSTAQKGFLRKRSMLQNIIDIDFEAMRISLSSPYGALTLFDFEAAFPSFSHESLWKVLSHIGVPQFMLRAFQNLYAHVKHRIKIKGVVKDSFTLHSGVRQGCPLSPVLFVVVVDLLLRRLRRLLPEVVVRAFADDIGIVTPNFHSTADTLSRIFREFARLSGLKLNMPKTVFIPLWPSSARQI